MVGLLARLEIGKGRCAEEAKDPLPQCARIASRGVACGLKIGAVRHKPAARVRTDLLALRRAGDGRHVVQGVLERAADDGAPQLPFRRMPIGLFAPTDELDGDGAHRHASA